MSDTTDPAAEEFPMMVTEAKLHTTSNTGQHGERVDDYSMCVCGRTMPCPAIDLDASDHLADLIAAAERRGATQRAHKIAAAMETASHTHRPDRPIWLHAARIARNTR